MAFGLKSEGSSSTSKSSSMDLSRNSLDSGYHSMIAKPRRGSQGSFHEPATFMTLGTESSPERSPRKLHKSISTTFSGAMQAFSKSVRSTTSYIYPTAGEPELPSSEWAECETPKKQSRRSSIMSSVRSRRQRFTPRASGAKVESLKGPQSPVPVTQEKAPALDVKIPNSIFSSESLKLVSVSDGSQIFATVELPKRPKNLWPGPTRLTFDQALGKDRQAILPPVSTDLEDPYVEQGEKLQHGLSLINTSSEFVLESPSPDINKRYVTDDKGYSSELESNADLSESDQRSTACPKYVAPGSPEFWRSLPCYQKDPAAICTDAASSTYPCEKNISSGVASSMPSNSEALKPKALNGTTEPSTLLDCPSRRYNRRSPRLGDGRDDVFLSNDAAVASKPGSCYKQPTSDVYDADAECLKTSMGSRTVWERHRADRERRYMKIVDMASDTESNEDALLNLVLRRSDSKDKAPDTESDEEGLPELELRRSPSKKPVHYAEEVVHGTVDAGRSESKSTYPTGDLRYAVEAIERLAFPVGDFAYAVEAIGRPSVTTFDPLETVFQQRPMLCLNSSIEEPESLNAPGSLYVPLSCMEASSSPTANLSSSRVELPSSPDLIPVESPAASKFTPMTMNPIDEDSVTFGQNIRRYSAKSTDVSAKSLPEQNSPTTPEDDFEARLTAGDHFVPTHPSMNLKANPVREDAYQAGLRAAGISTPSSASGVVQTGHMMDDDHTKATSIFTPILHEINHRTFRGQLEAGSPLPKQRSQNGTPFRYNRAVSALSCDTDDSRVITPYSPLGNAPPPSPNLHVQSEPARHLPHAMDAVATYEEGQIRMANAGFDLPLCSLSDGLGKQCDGAKLKSFDTIDLNGTDSPENHAQAPPQEQHDFENPSPGSSNKVKYPSNSSTPQETFNAAKLQKSSSPSIIAARKARRRCTQKKRSSGMGTLPFAEISMNAGNRLSMPDLNPPKRELIKDSAFDKKQSALGESPKTAGGSFQKPSSTLDIDTENRSSRNQASFEDLIKAIGDNVRWDHSSSKSMWSKSSPGGERQVATTSLMSPSPPRMRICRPIDKISPDGTHGNPGIAFANPKSHFEPEFGIKHFDSMSKVVPRDANGRSGNISYVGHELDSIFQADSPKYYHSTLDEGLLQEGNKKAIRFASSDETTGYVSDSNKDPLSLPNLKKKRELYLQVEKLAVQRQLKGKLDRARSRLLEKLKGETLMDGQIREDDSAQTGE